MIAMKKHGTLERLFKDDYRSIKFNALVRSVILYGAEIGVGEM